MKYKIQADVLSKAFMDLAKPIADKKGLEWKVWLHDPEKEDGGWNLSLQRSVIC